jgi:UMF1 family MFS transporter
MDKGDRQRAAWALYEWAQQPYWALIATFIFTPYFAAGFVGDAARGQSLLGYAGAITGLMIAVFSPLVGASVDARRNPRVWLVGLAVPFVLASAALWWATPGDASRVLPILACLVVAGVAAELSGSVMNALLPLVAKPGQVGRLSGSAWALAYVGALISLFVVLLCFSLPKVPMLGLSKALHEPDRIVGPLVAVWFLLFSWPLMLTAPQAPVSEAKKPLAELWATIRSLPQRPWMLRFLIGRMLIGDGISSFIAFGGVLAAGLFGWTTTQLGLYAIALSIAAGIGTFVGGRVDQKLGSKATVLIAAGVVLFGAFGVGMVGRDSLFFLWPVAPAVPGGPLFASLPERVFLGFSLFVGLTFGPAQASLRAWMAELAPAGESGRWFGLYALSGKATAFMAPLVIAVGTRLVGDQRIAVAVSALFMITGAAVLFRVPRQGPEGSAVETRRT